MSQTTDVQDVEKASNDVENGQTQSERQVTHEDSIRRRRKPLPPRMIDRNLPFFQSSNLFAVEHNNRWETWMLRRHDWFHILLSASTCLSLMLLLSGWTLTVLMFASLYVWYDERDPGVDCGLGTPGNPIGFHGAFVFSLITASTIGYGLPSESNGLFLNCRSLQVIVYFQVIISMMFNAFLFAFFYTRLAKADSRAFQVVFSKQAIVSRVNDQIRFQLRVYDMDAAHPVVESHVRLYALMRDRPVPRQLRILHPNDALGGVLLLSMPSVVDHHIDVHSMLHPPVENLPFNPSGLLLRQVDSYVGDRPSFICPVCGESYGTHERLVRHVRYYQIYETRCKYPTYGTHLSIDDSVLKPPDYPNNNVKELQEFFENEVAEVVCVVEGIDPVTSYTFQALHSYCAQDIVWDENAIFKPCLDIDGERIKVDLDLFHDITTLSTDTKVRARHKRNKTVSYRIQDCLCDAMGAKS